MKKITPFLWFDGQAEEAMDFYVSVFPHSKVLSRSSMSVSFELDGQEFIALNGGPQYQFTEAVSFFVNCEDQAEIDRLWSALTADGGSEGQCGWLKDKYGLSWQIIPLSLGRLISDPRGLQVMLGSKKLVIAELEAAVAG